MDMLVNLYTIPNETPLDGIRVERVLPPDIGRVLQWIEEHFGAGWKAEGSVALYAQPSTCFIAQKDGQIVGFACYDATAKGYFGPIGTDENLRRAGIGRALLLRCLHAMKEAGYGYAVIGWCNTAAPFYARCAGAIPIPGSDADKTAYSRMIRFSKEG